MKPTISEIVSKLESGPLGFWVRNYRMSYLLILLVVLLGVSSLFTIPKESAPDIKFGIISINTLYTGVSPEDIDALITNKIEAEIQDIDGIDTINSTSSLGFSNITVTLATGVDTSDMLTKIRDAVDKATLPSDAENPSISEISSDTEMVFSALLSADPNLLSKDQLYNEANILSNKLEELGNIQGVDIAGGDGYEIRIVLDQQKITNLGIDHNTIASAISSYNQNIPLGNFPIGGKRYDFRIDGEIRDFSELFSIPVVTQGAQIPLGTIAQIQRHWDNDAVKILGTPELRGQHYVQLNVNKVLGSNIFSTAQQAREAIEKHVAETDYLSVTYGTDMADIIRDDYSELLKNAAITLVLVFATVLFFVGVKEGIIATVSIPLAFLVTFFVLDKLGLSLNFMTNFSMVLTLGIAIDVTIVIIEAASEYNAVGYKPRNAVLLALRDYAKPLIAGTLTTLVVFVPMMVLPGILGKFLAYIPITVFTTLVAALLIALTVNTTLFFRFSKEKKVYHRRSENEIFSEEDTLLLQEDRKNKHEQKQAQKSPRERFLSSIENFYEKRLMGFLESKKSRTFAIIAPIVVLVFSFIVLAPKIGFVLFPQGDNPFIFIDISSEVGSSSDDLLEQTDTIEGIVSSLPELKFYSLSIDDENLNLSLEITKKSERQEKGQRSSQEIDTYINEELSYLKKMGFTVETNVESNGPPVGAPVGLKLRANDVKKLPELIEVSKVFEEYLKSLEGTKNVKNSSPDSPGQVLFRVDSTVASRLGVSPTSVYRELANISNGTRAGSIRTDSDDIDIVVYYDAFQDNVLPHELLNSTIQTSAGSVRLNQLVDYEISNAIQNIQREDGDIVISVNAELRDGYQAGSLQSQFQKYADSYPFPDGLGYMAAGENAENADLLVATAVSFVVALVMIFVILVLLFNSFLQPFVILYSVVLALLGINIGLFGMNVLHDIGLFFTSVPYSLPFGIGFIALTGIVVNDAIILIDKINRNIAVGMTGVHTVAEAGRSRLQPIILTTLTTVFGLLPLAFQDEFWAGLALTVIFGLFAGSAMTLFVIPAIYYELFILENSRLKTFVTGGYILLFVGKVFYILRSIIYFAPKRKRGKK